MHVLLVERNPELQQVFADALACEGFSVVAVADWASASRAAHEGVPAVVVVDASLEPGAAGRFVSELRHDGSLRDVPVAGIAFRFGSEQGILAAGVQCCIQKMPTPAEVVKVVRWATAVYSAPLTPASPPAG